MKLLRKTITLFLFFLFLLNGLKVSAQGTVDYNKPNTLAELRIAIQKTLSVTETPGAGVVLVSGDETILLEVFGKADLENNIDVNDSTMFRLGSISKMFVALAILKLQEEGRLGLKDEVRDLVPEIAINNPWEDKFPIRIENLLEHTAGWDEWHFAELGSDDPKPKTLRESMDFYPKGRTSRYIPGTRIGYSNAGTSLAAYIVEKVSGMTFEDYVDINFFRPMGIEDMTYLQSDEYKKMGAKLYDNGIALNYFNILYRPSAALNGSPKDVVKMIKFFLNRGKVNDLQLISDSSLRRMERSESMPIWSKSELSKGFGLANSANDYDGFVYHGHGGSVPGGNADFAYLPEYRMGYAVMINGGNEDAVFKIADLVKYYQTKDLPHMPTEIIGKKPGISFDPSGYYTIINPKIYLLGFIERIKNVQKVEMKNDTLILKFPQHGNSITKYLPAGNNEYRSVTSSRVELAWIDDPLEGNILFHHGYFKKISTWWAYSLRALLVVFPLTMVGTLIFGLLWFPVWLFGKSRNKKALWIGLWPLIPNSFVFLVLLCFQLRVHTKYDSFQLLGTMNPISIMFLVCGIGYAMASVWSVIYILCNHRTKMSLFFYSYSIIAAMLNLIFMFYFLGNGLIGIPTWL
ncbi:MAG TPA: serine hydrolase domain-containing protein [Prolixibacteraceae bacterium]|nr:serine hydrolase domain-containing protein [Prolixibacteraceae bacterium]